MYWLRFLIAFFPAVCISVHGATFTVSQDGRGQYSSVQYAINAAGPGDVVKILDNAVYDGQVTIDSTKNGLTLTSANPLSRTKPTIRCQDRFNVLPSTCAEAKNNETVNFDRNGALRLMRVRNVTVDGIIIDGGGPYAYGYDNIWKDGGVDCRWPLQYGNAALVLWIAGSAIIRNCEMTNAYIGVKIHDRNEGGIFANANPADIEPWNVVPLSGFGKTGNHLFEYNRIHDNSWGIFFESTWDLGSVIRYNLFYRNHHQTDAFAASVKGMTSEGANQPGGALWFKDHMLSPLAIYNNTFWHNFLIFAGHWRPGSHYLIFNNIYAGPHRYWGSDPNFQNPFHKLDHVFKYRMKHCVYASQNQAPTEYYVSIMNDFQVENTGGPVPPGARITTPFPAESEIRWLETPFKSTNPNSPDFLVPDWDDPLVQQFIIDKGWPDAGITDADGSIADLGAIPFGGNVSDLAVLKPLSPVIINGTTATITFDFSVLSGIFTNPEITYIRFMKNIAFQADAFGGNIQPVPATDILEVALPAGFTVRPGGNTLTVTVPARTASELYATFELIVEGTGSEGKQVASTAGFMPYRKMDYAFVVTVLDISGTSPLTEITAGDTVRIKIQAQKADGTGFNNTVKPVEISLNSGADLLTHEGTVFTVDSVLVSATKPAVFTKVPDGGVEYVMASGLWIHPGDPGNTIAFYGVSDGITILPGPPAKVLFQDPPSNSFGGINPPVIDPGINYPGELQVYDKYDNRINQAVQVSLASSRSDWADIAGDHDIGTDARGTGMFQVAVTNGPRDSIVTLTARIGTGATDAADMKIGQPLDQVWIFYGDVASYDPIAELRGQVGERLPVTIWASIDGTMPIPSRANTVSINALATSPSLRFYASQTSTAEITSVTLVGGEAQVWVSSLSIVNNGGMQAFDNTDNTLIAGEKSVRSRIYFTRNPTQVDSAFYYADNGFGAVNRAEIYYKRELAAPPDSIILYWPNKNAPPAVVRKEETQMTLAADNRHVTVMLTTPFPAEITFGNGLNGAGFGTSWDRPNPDVPAESSEFHINDRVGPLLTRAQLLERFTSGNDTITVTFSEQVNVGAITGVSFLLIKQGNDTPIPLSVTGPAINAGGEITVTFAIADLGLNAPAPGDSLRIIPAGSVTDKRGNHAHEQNRPVVITIKSRPVPLNAAWYKDEDGNGIVEKVALEFMKEIDIQSISRILIVWENDTGTVLPVLLSAVTGNPDRLDAAVTNIFGNIQHDRTGGNMTVTVYYKEFEESFTVTALDSAAPVIVSALYSPGEIIDASSSRPDTLTVTFSESVAPIRPETPFRFYNITIGTYGMTFDSVRASTPATYHFRIESLDGAITYPGSGDSIWIHYLAGISDIAGNTQDVDDNKRVSMTVKPKPYKIVTRVGPNPFNPETDAVTISDGGIALGTFSGVVIEVDPVNYSLPQSADDPLLQAEIAIYDAPGTILALYDGNGGNTSITMTRSSVSGKIYFSWNGRNRNNRYVGTGSYLALITIRDNNGAGEIHKKMIGVKR